MALLAAWILMFLLPPLAVLVLPDKCVPDKGTAFLVALLLSLIFVPLAWLYEAPMISSCEAKLSQPKAVAVVTPTTTESTSGKVVVVTVKG